MSRPHLSVYFCKHFSFRLSEKKPILSIKFSPVYDILSLQRCENIIEFIIFKNSSPCDIFSHAIKNKKSRILGFFWTNPHEIVIITESGLEFYQVMVEKKSLKFLKSFSLTVEWFVYQVSRLCYVLVKQNFHFPFRAASFVHVAHRKWHFWQCNNSVFV